MSANGTQAQRREFNAVLERSYIALVDAMRTTSDPLVMRARLERTHALWRRTDTAWPLVAALVGYAQRRRAEREAELGDDGTPSSRRELARLGYAHFLANCLYDEIRIELRRDNNGASVSGHRSRTPRP